MRARQREIPPDRFTDPELLAAPKPARLTGMGLWRLVDDEGRMELRSDLIAGSIYPGDPMVTAATIEDHILDLFESGFLQVYSARGRDWVALTRPLRTPRPLPSSCPPPPQEVSGGLLAVGGVGAGWERVRAEDAARARTWAEWGAEQERDPVPPRRPLLMDAPPIGCPDHPHGRFEDCGPCGTARRRHDHWVAAQRYSEQVERGGG